MATPNFTTLLHEAVNKPGTIMKAYSAFHNYSLGNQLLALVQCQLRGIEPGPIKTDFYTRSASVTKKEGLTAYDNFVARALPNLQRAGETAPDGRIVAEAIYDAATDDSWKMRYPVNSQAILAARRLLPDALFLPLVRRAVVK